MNLTKEITITNTVQKEVWKILNDILEKNFTVSNIKVGDYYSFEQDFVSKIKTELNKTMAKETDFYFLDANQIKTVRETTIIEGEEKRKEVRLTDLEIAQELKQLRGTPAFPMEFLKQSKTTKRNAILIVKDFDLLFKDRVSQLRFYHCYESELQYLMDNNIKIVFLTKSIPKTLLEAELSWVTYEYSNENRRRKLIEAIKEYVKTEELKDLDVQELVRLTNNYTIVSLENVLKESYRDSKELINLLEKKKLTEITEKNPEIRIKTPSIKYEQLIGLNNAKHFIKSGMEKKKIKSVMLLGTPGNGIKK